MARVIRCPVLVRTAVAAAAALLVTACSAGAGPDAPQGPSTAAVSTARVSHTLPDDPVRMVLPATGAETRWTQGLYVFGQQVTRAAAAECAREGGFALPEEIPLAFIRYFELPDLDFIRRHGLRASAEIPGPAPAAGTARTGTAAEVRRCRAQGTAAADALRGTYAELQGRWFSELVSLRQDPGTMRARRALPGCLAGQGVQARDEQTFMAVAQTREHRAAPADLARTEQELGRVYADCMRPVEAVRDPVRLRARAHFVTENAAEVRALRTALLPAVHRAERRYGLRMVFPTP
ncbi:hypothetical protein ABZ307_03315 [Streptomyces griseorubiginosus]|uniref:hypothetical protein n=1 Tax=Streptomyces griseorubiginosus TaxID=67304 RepID=UPI0033B77722